MRLDRIAGGVVVDHRHPIHDEYCRCRSCKPPLVGARRLGAGGKLLLILVVSALLWAAIHSLAS